MDFKYLIGGAILGGLLGFWRLRSAPTGATAYTPFGKTG